MTGIFLFFAAQAKPRFSKPAPVKRDRRFQALMMQSFADMQARTPKAA